MFEQALDEPTRAVLLTIGSARELVPCYLAGGTAVALHFGHRLSHDLDLFTDVSFAPPDVAARLGRLGRFELERAAEGTVSGRLDGVPIALFHYPYPLLEEPAAYAEVRVAGLRDLGAMKLSAISQRGTRRDFIDLHLILTRSHALDELLSDYRRKYGASESAIPHLLKSLSYFDDAEAEPMPRLLVPADWGAIKRQIAGEAERVGRSLFGG